MSDTEAPEISPERQAIGARIRSARKLHGMTQTALAARCFVGQTAVAHWEAGRKMPDLSRQLLVADALHSQRAILFRELDLAERAA